MFSSDKGIVAALAGCLTLAAVGLWDHHQRYKPETLCSRESNPPNCRPQQFISERAGIYDPIERAISNPEPTSGEDHEKRDLAAQEVSAVFAFWMVIFSGVGTFITFIGTILLYRQIKLTRDAVIHTADATSEMEKSNEIAKTAQRAWIKIPKVGLTKMELRNNPDRPDIGDHFVASIEVDVENVGKLPAMTVACIPRLWLNSANEVSFNEWQKGWEAALGDARATVISGNVTGRILFPNDTDTFKNGISTSTFPVPGTLPVDRNSEDSVRIFVTVFVFYQISVDDWRHTMTNIVLAGGRIANWVNAGPKEMPDLHAIHLVGADQAT